MYCTAWTYFGSVGRAASGGLWFLPIYLGPTMAMVLGWVVLRKIIRKEAGDGSGLIYGMGHAVYTLSDPRAQILKNHARSLAYKKGYDEEYNMLCSIERLAPEIFAEEKHGPKKVCANVDLFSGLIYRMLGISEDLYTPLFAIARVPGWCAHRVEEVEYANRIIRPAYKYLGEPQEYLPLEER